MGDFIKLLKLFLSFAKIGAFTFGGGYAMLPMMEKELVERRNWVTSDEIIDYFAISQCTPGVIAVNTATFIGFKIGGFFGAIFATFGVVFPSVIIIASISSVLSTINDVKINIIFYSNFLS